MAKKKARKEAAQQSKENGQPEDAMSQIALLCQEQRWREAALLCRQAIIKANESGNTDLAMGIANACVKIDYSLRRQMATTLITASKEFLKKEYLLDVGQ